MIFDELMNEQNLTDFVSEWPFLAFLGFSVVVFLLDFQPKKKLKKAKKSQSQLKRSQSHKFEAYEKPKDMKSQRKAKVIL